MFQRNIAEEEVLEAIESGITIEEYPNDYPYPSQLLLGQARGRPLHVVVGEDNRSGTLFVVTGYEPDLMEWEPGFRTRRRQ